MGEVAKHRPRAPEDLPAPPSGLVAPETIVRPARTGRFTHGLPVAEVLGVPSLAGATVLAGASGLHRVVARLNVMEVPDILPWVKPDELLLTTGYPLRDTPEALVDLVEALDARGLAALGVKLGRYLSELPAPMLARADELGLPVIRLPDGVAFDDVLNQVLTDVLNQQAAVLARAEDVHFALARIVLGGGALGEVCSELARLLDASVLVTTPDGRVQAEAGAPAEIDRLRGGPCFDATGRFRTEDEPRGVSTHAGLTGSHAVVPIVAGSLDHGRLVAFAGRELLAADVHALEGAAIVAALAVTRDLAVSAVEEKYRGDFLRDLLAGRADSRTDVVTHAAGLGWDLDRDVLVLVAEPDPSAAGPGGNGEVLPPTTAGHALRPVHERFAAAWRSVLTSRDPRAAVERIGSEVVVVLGLARGADPRRMVRDLVSAVSGAGGGGRRSFSAGVSRPVPAGADLPRALARAYEQARTALRVSRQLGTGAGLAHFDDLGALRLLSLLPDAREVDSFVAETLGPLAEPSDPEARDLRTTLAVLLEHNLNVAEAARELHFHYNTLRYRIGKLERALGPFTREPARRLDLMLALQVLALREQIRQR